MTISVTKLQGTGFWTALVVHIDRKRGPQVIQRQDRSMARALRLARVQFRQMFGPVGQ
jgi:hypothetical protein